MSWRSKNQAIVLLLVAPLGVLGGIAMLTGGPQASPLYGVFMLVVAAVAAVLGVKLWMQR